MVVASRTPVVVVGVDGSSSADAAVQWAQQYAAATGASLRLVVAWEWPMSYGYPMAFDGFDPKTDATHVVEKVVAGLTLAPERIETRIVEGSAGAILLDAAHDADLLVVGRRGHGAVASQLLGSVSAHAVHHGTTPVVVVRSPEPAAGG